MYISKALTKAWKHIIEIIAPPACKITHDITNKTLPPIGTIDVTTWYFGELQGLTIVTFTLKHDDWRTLSNTSDWKFIFEYAWKHADYCNNCSKSLAGGATAKTEILSDLTVVTFALSDHDWYILSALEEWNSVVEYLLERSKHNTHGKSLEEIN